jgi:geranylgeranyl pyrophosphate synthase
MARAPAETASRIEQILRSPGNHKREQLGPDLLQSGALAYARCRAEDLAARAAAELTGLPPTPYRAALETLTDHVVHRSS